MTRHRITQIARPTVVPIEQLRHVCGGFTNYVGDPRKMTSDEIGAAQDGIWYLQK